MSLFEPGSTGEPPAARENVSTALEAFQVQLEAVRAHPNNEQLQEDLRKAEAALLNAMFDV